MSQTSNDFDSMNSIYKEAYADRIKDLIPDGVKLLNKIKFRGAEKSLGNLYHQPVTLGLEHGISTTYAV